MRFVKGLMPLVLDTESYYDSKSYTLRKMSTTEYVRDERFKLHGFGYVMPGMAPRWVTAADAAEALKGFDWSRVALVCHNAKHDGLILAERYGIRPALYVDTMCMSFAVHGALLPSHSLSSLAEHYGLPEKGQMLTDGIRDLVDFQEKELSEYCIHDVEITAEIFERMRDDFPEGELDIMDWSIRTFTTPKLMIDVPLMESVSKDEAARREAFFVSPLALECAAAIEASEPVALLKSGKPRKRKPVEPKKVFASNDMFPRVLQHFGYGVPTKPSPAAVKKGEDKQIPALAVGDPEFVEMLEGDDARLRELCEARVAAKSTLLETRSGKFAKVGKTGEWPFDAVFSGAKQTHRLSGGAGGGGNPQNLRQCKDPEGHAAGHDCPARMRAGIIAPAGHKLAVGDFAQVEPRVLAWLANDRELQAAFASGDPYCAFGTRFYGRTITKKDRAERNFSKVGVIAPGYGMGWEKLVKKTKIDLDIDLPEEKARATIDFYRSTYGGVPALWKYLENLLPFMAEGKSGYLHTLPAVKWDKEGFILPSGLRIRYPQLHQREVTRKGKTKLSWGYIAYRQKRNEPDFVPLWGGLMTENLCQALAGEICKHSMRLLGLKPVFGQIHDELIVVTRTEDAEATRHAMERAMTTPPAWFPGIVLGAEVGVGDNWLEAKA